MYAGHWPYPIRLKNKRRHQVVPHMIVSRYKRYFILPTTVLVSYLYEYTYYKCSTSVPFNRTVQIYCPRTSTMSIYVDRTILRLSNLAGYLAGISWRSHLCLQQVKQHKQAVARTIVLSLCRIYENLTQPKRNEDTCHVSEITVLIWFAIIICFTSDKRFPCRYTAVVFEAEDCDTVLCIADKSKGLYKRLEDNSTVLSSDRDKMNQTVLGTGSRDEVRQILVAYEKRMLSGSDTRTQNSGDPHVNTDLFVLPSKVSHHNGNHISLYCWCHPVLVRLAWTHISTLSCCTNRCKFKRAGWCSCYGKYHKQQT